MQWMTVWIFQGAVLHGLSIEQYNWPSGFASNISIMLHSSHWIELQGERAAGVKKLGTTLLLFQWRMEAQWLFGRLKRSQFTQETSHFSSRRCLEEIQVAPCNITQPQVGPYPGSAFGGMKDIKLRGCLASQVRQPVLAVHILLFRQFWTLKRI